MRKTAFLVAAVFAGCSAPAPAPAASARPSFRIAVIPQGATHEFWKSIHAGAVKAAQDLKASTADVTLFWKAPLREDDREQQVQVVEGFLAQGISGIVLAPFDRRALV